MGIIVPHKAIGAISTAADPKQAILDFVGDLSRITILTDEVLVGILSRPEKTKGGIIRPDINKEEDIWQGKVGLVLKWGVNAFRDKETGEIYDERAEVGQWVQFRVSDLHRVTIRDFPCGLIRDVNIRMRIEDDPMIIL